ncbi:MAG: uracil-DNA glycosylase family protein [Verrucomicrobiae bacterium]|nr:uracil-DNA glycosylase family protein [Verrucomicrobiae bacterium]
MKSDPQKLPLHERIRACTACAEHLPHRPRPIFSCHEQSRILIVGQAPGRHVHESGVPWQDASGRQLRLWLGVSEEEFYDPKRFALMSLGFCYPGRGPAGDLPPRSECAPLWHPPLLAAMPEIRLILLVGQYAQKYYLPETSGSTLTENVRRFREFLPRYFPLPHPSPRNRRWIANNPWCERDLLPELRKKIRACLGNADISSSNSK